jgi:hypothetical protein
MMSNGYSDYKGSNASHKAWARRSQDLADWTWHALVNRTDAWGGYRPLEEVGREYTRTNGTKGRLGDQKTVRGCLTRAILIRHFQAQDRSAIIGLHTADRDNLSKGGGLDIDYHRPSSTRPEVNLHAALWWYGELVRRGFHPLLTESNGRGGFHLRVLLRAAIPADRLYYFLQGLTRDHRQLGFERPPEQFPKQPDVRQCRKGLGNWLRLPGRHPKREFWSRVWDGERWLAGHAAIDYLLALGDDAGLIPAAAPAPKAEHSIRCRGVRQVSSSCALPTRIRNCDLAGRIRVYLSKLPNLAAGQGRDDVAFQFAALLVRDLRLSDAAALSWLMRWDRRNRPPKGAARLLEIIASAHRYGRHAYGSGLSLPAAKPSRTQKRHRPVETIRFVVRG